MRKKTLFGMGIMVVVLALAATLSSGGTACAASDSLQKCLPAGTYCFNNKWEGTSDPLATKWTEMPTDSWVVQFTPAGSMAYSVSSYMANDPVSGVPAFCTGNAQEEGGQVVTTLTCQEGSIAANYYTNAWIVQVTYACSTKGKLASSGTWDAIYTYAFPEGYPPAELKAGLYGPYYSWGTSVPVACKK